ncbi:MAG: DNA-binding HxlR family transcriptional regulator [Saprospiraceae bacterium]|jgi:DNA-binding HxlR family transcriptional regulator
MGRTIADNQELILKEKIKIFFSSTRQYNSQEFCPIRDVLANSLDKWSLFVLYNLGYNQVMRFNELKKRIDGISSRMLSTTLKKLEANDMITRMAYAEVPPRVEYRLTDFGKDFADRIIDLSQWYLESYERKG